MIKQLVSLQFVFLFCPIYILSLVNYGSDFRGSTGWFYVAALILISLLHFSHRYWSKLLNKTVNQIILIMAVVVGTIAYRQLHFNVWDEHSLSQAILFSVFAVLSYLGSVIAICAEKETTHDDPYQLAKILIIFTLCWLCGLAYPHSLFFFVALFFGLALIHLSWVPIASRPSSNKYSRENLSWERYVVFVVTLDIALVIWDYKVSSLWAGFVAVTLLAAAMGTLWSNVLPRKNQPWVITIMLLNLLLAVVSPLYVLNYLHYIVTGLGIGILLVWSFRKQPHDFDQGVADHWPFVILGLMLSYVFYVHLSLTYWRAIFVIPFLYLGIKASLKLKLRNSI